MTNTGQSFDAESCCTDEHAVLMALKAKYGVAAPVLATPLAPQSGAQPIVMDCVLREVSYKDTQYVPVCEVPLLNPGETIFRGAFNTQVESHGPSGSHKRTICLPVSGLKHRKAPGKRPRK